MARNNNRPSNNNRRARNNMTSFIPQARQSIQDRQVNLRNANTRIDYSQSAESFWSQLESINSGTWLRDHLENFSNTSITPTTSGDYSGWIHPNELETRQRWERQTQELLSRRMFSEQIALGRDLQVDIDALEEATGTQYVNTIDGAERHYSAYQSAGISWRDIPINPIDNLPPEPGNIGGPYNNESLNESLAQSLEEMVLGNPDFLRMAERVRELQQSNALGFYGRSRRRTGYSGLSGVADGQYIRYGTPGEDPEKIYGERMDNMIIIQNDSSPLLSWMREKQGWGRGYVIVRKSSYLYHIDPGEIPGLFQVHGGITCQSIITPVDIESWGKYLHLTEEDLDHLILGFDTSHYSNEGLKTREEVLEETGKLQLQIASYG